MCRPLAIVVVAVLVAAGPGFSQTATGDLLVTCWPGHRVLLDGEPAGVTVSEEDGRYLTGLAAGVHVVTIEKDGFVPREYRVEVPAAGLVELKVEDLEPAVGAIQVLAEAGWRVYLDGRLIGLTSAGDDGLLVPDVASGSHHVRVEKLGREPVEAEVEVLGGVTVEVAIGAEDELVAPVAPVAAAAATAAPQPSPATPPAAPDVLDTASASLPESSAAPIAASPAADFDLDRKAPSPADVLFAYRARGAGLAGGGSVNVTRERGGPRAPVMVFWCVDQAECRDQTRPAFAPGHYRFRVNCRAGRAVTAADADAFVELDAVSGGSYLIDVVFDATCTATAVAVSGSS